MHVALPSFCLNSPLVMVTDDDVDDALLLSTKEQDILS